MHKSGFDYSQPGAYFVTVCVKERNNLLGTIENGEVTLAPLGFLLADHWRKIPKHYCNVFLDAWVVMPNHLHGIMLLHKAGKASELPAAANLSSIVGSFKSGVSRDARRLGLIEGPFLQPRFHDHIIRHERALLRVQEYIVNNPVQWSLDRENPLKTGVNEFYTWLEAYSRLSNDLGQTQADR